MKEGASKSSFAHFCHLTQARDRRCGLVPGVEDALSRWPDKVAEYRGGKRNLIGMFVGEVMKATQGAADPKTVRELLSERLDP